MRLVDGEQAQLVALIQGVQQRQKARVGHPFGRGVQQRGLPTQQALLHLVRLFTAQGGIQECRADTGLVQGTHLVVHQRDQRRHHDTDAQARALAGDGRDLVTQGLAAPGGHQHQRITTIGHVFHNGLLRPAELRVAKDLLQDGVAGLAGDGGIDCYQNSSWLSSSFGG